ncbi:hypothetical protein BCR35DRAFT_330170 [Leucosporidium creatinivorum]|uniref:F-box domain-containing protein n=1 Tax=Leucosporidium creatinivorum TaxID=106004 RepID=A0A1Y2G099_9BASI|nr:hypothetical protein BCR35DRAFT_330170 [Leucosporidium creatinivorum]
MVVIQDLPLELLYRILDVAFDYPFDPTKCSFLHRTALVAHSWTKPSLKLLYASPSLERNLPACRAQLAYLEKQADGAAVVRALLLLPTLDTLNRFAASVEKLRYLHLVHSDEGIDVQLLGPKMLLNLEVLVLQATLTGAFLEEQRFAFLNRLEFTLGQLSTTLLTSLVDNSPLLYYLQITWSESWSTDVEIACPPLLALAPELRHFGFVLAGFPSPGATAELERFLPTCTALKSFELRGLGAWELGSVLSALLSALASQPAVVTIGDLRTEQGGNGVHVSFLAALSSPGLVSLKRWRYYDWAATSSASRDGKAEWEAACSERGIETSSKATRSGGRRA